jgi:hypothetical protein
MPYLHLLVGQAGGAGGGGGTPQAAAPGTAPCSGILGCLSRPDWATRRAAADALTALALVLGPRFEAEAAPDGGSLLARSVDALEAARFDKARGQAGWALRPAAVITAPGL